MTFRLADVGHRRPHKLRCSSRAGPTTRETRSKRTSRRSTPASSAAVMKPWRSVCAPTRLSMLARRATRRTRCPGRSRSSRWPMVVTKIGPTSGSPMAQLPALWAVLRHGHDLGTLAEHGQDPVAPLEAKSLDVGPDGLRVPQPGRRQERDNPVTLGMGPVRQGAGQPPGWRSLRSH